MEHDYEVLPACQGMAQPSVIVELPETAERTVLRFAAPSRREIRRLMRSSKRIADLCDTFPGLLYALATRHGPASARLNALSAIEGGAPLKTVARSLALPMWMRRLPPEAFGEIANPLPHSPSFARQIAHRMPRTASESRQWLRGVQFAAEACNEEFAIWLAAQPIFASAYDPRRSLAVLSAYAWYSGRPDTSAFKLIVVPWRPEISLETALCAAKSWFNRLRLVLQMTPGAITDPWLKAGSAGGYTFESLLDADALLEEAQAMHNCADQYAERIVRDKCRLFSVKRNGVRAATLEVGPHAREGGVLAITQLKSRHNMAVTADIWQAAYTWLGSQNGLKRLSAIAAAERPWDQPCWWSMLAPYRNTHGGSPWFDPVASHLSFAALDSELCDLARRGGVSSWLFT